MFQEGNRTRKQTLGQSSREFPILTIASYHHVRRISAKCKNVKYFSAETANPESIGPSAGAANIAATQNDME
jgi:hypothetical protein